MRYTMLVFGEGDSWGGSFPDVPGCTVGASTLDGLIEIAPEVLSFHLEGTVSDGEPIPTPRPLAELRADPVFADEFAEAVLVTLVEIDPPGQVVRVNITLRETDLAAIDRAAASEGKSRSGYLVAAARQRMAG